MGKVLAWVAAKVRDRIVGKGIDWLIAGMLTSLLWLLYSPIWGGWRAICIAISAGILALGIVALYRQENGGRQTKTNGKPSDDAELKVLLGSWNVQKATACEPTYLAVWKFTADHRVSAKTQGYETGGSWQFESARVLIDWDHPLSNGQPCFDTFHRPIIASGVRGDSWGGRHELNKVRASKIAAGT